MESTKQILSVNRFDSPLEKKLFFSLRSFGLEAKTLFPFEIFFVDLAFPDRKIAIEVDGFEFHRSKDRQAKDKYKEGRLKLAGWSVERFDGWFVYRYSDLAAGEIAYRYFKDRLSEEQKKHISGLLAGFFATREPDMAIQVIENG